MQDVYAVMTKVVRATQRLSRAGTAPARS